MVATARITTPKAFFITGFDGLSLQQAFSSVVTSLTSTRAELSRLGFAPPTEMRPAAAKREVYRELPSFVPSEWNVFNNSGGAAGDRVRRMKLEFKEDPRMGTWRPVFVEAPFLDARAAGIAVRREYFGEGAERIVHRMTEIDGAGRPVGTPLVAKDSKFRGRGRDHATFEFHKSFIKTQMKASGLARKFNEKLDRLGVGRLVPRVEFLDCCVYVCGGDGPNAGPAFLCEPLVDAERYKKWNNNAGGVDGIARQNAVPTPDEEATRERREARDAGADGRPGGPTILECVAEGGGDSGSDGDEDGWEPPDSGDNVKGGAAAAAGPGRAMGAADVGVLDSDVPQAFTHFTNRHTHRKLMVCDIQGVLDAAGPGGPVFRLTDPCIHYESSRGRVMVHGRTDKGRRGMHEFFKTHQCNALCRILGLHDGPGEMAAGRSCQIPGVSSLGKREAGSGQPVPDGR
jgi:hypothetical protein